MVNNSNLTRKNKSLLERIGIIGIFLTALTSPCCFPLFGVALSAMGAGSFELFGGLTLYIFLVFVVLTLIGTLFSFMYHKKWIPLATGVLSAAFIFYNYFFNTESNNGMYIGMMGLMITGIMNYYETKIFNLMKGTRVVLQSIITCPDCGYKKEETMPSDACEFFYECEHCKARLKPKQGDCCVYCSYGSVSCPSVQQGGKSCC